MEKRFKIEVGAFPVRDPKQETPLYRIPDPENWEAFYRAQKIRLGERESKDENGNFIVTELNKCVVITKGQAPVELEVNEHLLKFLQSDRNIFVKVLHEVRPAEEKRKVA